MGPAPARRGNWLTVTLPHQSLSAIQGFNLPAAVRRLLPGPLAGEAIG